MAPDIRTTEIVLRDGDNLWDKLKERTPELAYTEDELVHDREILAFTSGTSAPSPSGA